MKWFVGLLLMVAGCTSANDRLWTPEARQKREEESAARTKEEMAKKKAEAEHWAEEVTRRKAEAEYWSVEARQKREEEAKTRAAELKAEQDLRKAADPKYQRIKAAWDSRRQEAANFKWADHFDKDGCIDGNRTTNLHNVPLVTNFTTKCAGCYKQIDWTTACSNCGLATWRFIGTTVRACDCGRVSWYVPTCNECTKLIE